MFHRPVRAAIAACFALGATAALLAACTSTTATPTTSSDPPTTAMATTASPTTASPTTETSATAAPPPGQVLAVSTMDDMFMGPARIASGLTTIELHNSGHAPHQVQLLRLHDGVTSDQALAAAKGGDPRALLALSSVAGGANAVGPGGDQAVTVDLLAGTYLEVCFVPDPDGVSHLAKGMVSVLTVAGDAVPAELPAATGSVTLHDFSFDLPAPFDGQGTLRVVNDGAQPHELTILALAPGRTVDDATAFLSATEHTGPPPFTDAGGLGAIGVGQTAWVELHLQPGNYAAVCLVPDPATGKPHVMLGMATAFTVG